MLVRPTVGAKDHIDWIFRRARDRQASPISPDAYNPED
jgi:hypothetical protein